MAAAFWIHLKGSAYLLSWRQTCKCAQLCHVRVSSPVFSWHLKHHYDKADYHPSAVLAEATC